LCIWWLYRLHFFPKASFYKLIGRGWYQSRPNCSESTSRPNWHFDSCVTCNYSSYISALLFLFYFILLYFLCKEVFIVTPCFFIALSLTVLSLVRRFGQKRLLND